MTTPTEYLRTVLAREEAATKGPWEFFGGLSTFAVRRVGGHWERVIGCDVDEKEKGDKQATGIYAGGVWKQDDANFIAHARDDVPALVVMLEVAVEALRQIDQSLHLRLPNEGAWENQCPYCFVKVDCGPIKHRTGCLIFTAPEALAKLQALVPGEKR